MKKIICPICESELTYKRDSTYGVWGYWCKNKKCVHHKFTSVGKDNIITVKYKTFWDHIMQVCWGYEKYNDNSII